MNAMDAMNAYNTAYVRMRTFDIRRHKVEDFFDVVQNKLMVKVIKIETFN